MKRYLFVLFAIFGLTACTNDEGASDQTITDSDTVSQEGLDKKLIGSWKNTALKVKINTALNGDSTGYIDVDESNWERVLKTKPMTTTFTEDGTYSLQYVNMSDSAIIASSGTWYVLNDSLFLNQKQPDVTHFQYKVDLGNNTAKLTGLVDWEGDGEVDDEYEASLAK